MAARTRDPHASRLAQETIDQRIDPVLWGEGDGPLEDARLRAYGRRGLISGRVFADAEVAALRAEAERLTAMADPTLDSVVTEPGSEVIRSVFRVHQANEAFRALCKDARLADVARQILGSDVYIHQSRLNLKPGFDGREFYWHSDFETWHMEDGMPRMRSVSVSVALTENAPYNGPLMVIPGSHMHYVRCEGETPEDHYRQSLKKQSYGTPSRDAILELGTRAGTIDVCTGPAGSATFFDCNAMHGSAASLSPWPRINLFLVYNSVDNVLVRPYCGRRPRPAFLGERQPVPVDRL